MAWGAVGGKEKEVGASREGGAGERSGLWRGGRVGQEGTGRATQQAGTGAGGRQAKGVLRGKETKEKRDKNSPLILQRGWEGAGAGSGGVCAEVGREAQTSPASQPLTASPETGGMLTAILRGAPHSRSGARNGAPGAGRHTEKPSRRGPPCPAPPHPRTQQGNGLTCLPTTMGPASHEALCVQRCCQTHQLHPQWLLTQAWHLNRAQPWGRGGATGRPGSGGGCGSQ